MKTSAVTARNLVLYYSHANNAAAVIHILGDEKLTAFLRQQSLV